MYPVVDAARVPECLAKYDKLTWLLSMSYLARNSGTLAA